MSDVKLLVSRGSVLIYEHVRNRTKQPDDLDTGFYMDDYLDVKDVTHDGVPEILFHSGYQGVSGYTKEEHILFYDNSKASFRDIAPESFYNSTTHGLRWLDLAGRTFAVLADRNWPATVRLEDQCHACASPF